jgi:ATP-dependent DNA helicase RecG
LEGLPFALTAHQLQALDELDADLARTVPMRRLLQGDVGSGKTVVALYCLVRAAEAGFQGALMAPTETLAIQHAETAARLAGALAPAELLTAALTAKERRAALQRIASGAARLVIGTHALLQEDVTFAGLALLVVDEQHRFGVEQRDALVRRAERGGRAPHVLHMTATPIPRTLALTVYGDLDVTTIAGSPAGRQPVVTRLVDEGQREVGYEFVRKQVARGRQVYVVCPAIDESESISAATAVAEAERLQAGPFRDSRVAVVHGQLRSADRDAVMHAFKAGEVQVLVSTSLIEVGIDVANASVMIVEGAERFGLAQLHQLRGRVGRGTAKSYCLLFSQAETGASQARLEALLETNDGFELADRDLEIRGEGQVMGAGPAGGACRTSSSPAWRATGRRCCAPASSPPRSSTPTPTSATPSTRRCARPSTALSATSSPGSSRPDGPRRRPPVYCRHAYSGAHRDAHQHGLRRLRGDGRGAQAVP